MAITVREYRTNAEGVYAVVREEQVGSNAKAQSRIRRWCREAGNEEGRDPLAHNPDLLEWADTEYGEQASLEWEATGEPGSILWETEQGL
jgi:hypothetical protein